MQNKKEFEELDNRLSEAVKKHPEFAEDERHAVSLISEELGELSAEVNDKSPGWIDRAVMEAYHVAVTAIRTVKMLKKSTKKSKAKIAVSAGSWELEETPNGFRICEKGNGWSSLAWIGDTNERTREENMRNGMLMAGSKDLAEVLAEAVSMYGKPGGPWNVPGDPGSWLYRARKALENAGVENATT